MAATSIADEEKELVKEKAEYNQLYIMLLSEKYKLNGKDLFSAIESGLDELEKMREGETSDDKDGTSSEKIGMVKGMNADTARYSNFSHNNVSEGALNE